MAATGRRRSSTSSEPAMDSTLDSWRPTFEASLHMNACGERIYAARVPWLRVETSRDTPPSTRWSDCSKAGTNAVAPVTDEIAPERLVEGRREVKRLMETAVTARQVRLFIGGQWRDASEGKTFEQVSPATGDVIGVVADGTRDDARAAVDAANRARHPSARLSILERAALCDRIADTIVARQSQLAPELS